MQSIFSPAARRTIPALLWLPDRRGGGLKMDWTKPRPDYCGMGIE
jgi:hypothetical protein